MAHGVVATWPRAGTPNPDTGHRRRPGRRIRFGVVTYLLAQAVLLFWWAARYPGLFSPDSLDHVWQASTDNWNTHHPVTYTGLVWLSLRLTDGVGALTLAQSCALAAGLTYAVTGLRRLGGPAWAWTTAAVVVVALPPVGTFVVCVWKDVPYVICHVFLLGTLARLLAARRPAPLLAGLPAAGHRPAARHRPDPPSRGPLLRALLVELALIGLFRQNGVVVVAIVTVLVALLLRAAAFRVLLAGVVAATVALLTNWALLPALGVRDSESIVAYEAVLSDLAIGYARDPLDLPAADAKLLATVAPLTHWRRSANCYTVDPTVYHPDFDRRAAAAHRDELVSAWWRLVRRSPGTVLAAHACRASIAWRPTPAGGLSVNPTAWALPIYLDRDPRFRAAGVQAVAYSQPLSDRASRVADLLSRRISEPEWLLWRGATWAYLAYLTVGLLAWRRRDRALLVLATLSLGNQLSVLAVNNAQAARYMAAPFVLGVLLLPLLAAGSSRSAPAVRGAPSETDPTGRTPPGDPDGFGRPEPISGDGDRHREPVSTDGDDGRPEPISGDEPTTPLRVTELTVAASPGITGPADQVDSTNGRPGDWFWSADRFGPG